MRIEGGAMMAGDPELPDLADRVNDRAGRREWPGRSTRSTR